MKRTDLIALADELECLEREQADIVARNTIHAMVQFARQIAESKPAAWRVEVRWADGSCDWSKYAEYRTEQAAKSSQSRLSSPGDIEWRVAPIYTLPLED